jgi:hypothetical protein
MLRGTWLPAFLRTIASVDERGQQQRIRVRHIHRTMSTYLVDLSSETAREKREDQRSCLFPKVSMSLSLKLGLRTFLQMRVRGMGSFGGCSTKKLAGSCVLAYSLMKLLVCRPVISRVGSGPTGSLPEAGIYGWRTT